MQVGDTEILPIEKRKIKGQVQHILMVLPALDAQWITSRRFSFYIFPPCKLADGNYVSGVKETWLEFMSNLLDDIWWLCELQYHKFWSQVIYDKSSMNGVKSFLHLAPLQKLYFRIEDQEILSMYKRIKNAVFQFMKRLLRTKESDLNFMSKEKYKEIMSDNDLVPISLLFCLCTVYGKEKETVHALIRHSFEHNINLKLDKVVLRSVQLFSRLKKKLKTAFHDLRRNVKYLDNASEAHEVTNVYRQCLLSTIQFMTNAVVSISNFLHIYKEGCDVFLNFDFDFNIIRVFKKLLVPAYQEVDVLFSNGQYQTTKDKIILMLDLTRFELMKLFSLFLQASLEKMNNDSSSLDVTQRFVKVMKFALKDETLIFNLNNLINIEELLDSVKNKSPSNVDLIGMDRVTQAITELLSETNFNRIMNDECSFNKVHVFDDNVIYICEYVNNESDGNDSDHDRNRDYALEDDATLSDDDSSDYSDWNINENSDYEYEIYLEDQHNEFETKENGLIGPFSNSTEKLKYSEVQIQTAISHIKDLLPHLGEGFIMMCLQHYNMDSAAVINAIFENKLPESLQTVDFTITTIPDYILEDLKSESEDMVDRHLDQPKSELKEFKKIEYTSYKEMFNDKKDINELKSIYEKFRNIEEDEIYNDDVNDEEEEIPVAALEVDPEGFYSEYAKLPAHNPNHMYEVEDHFEPEIEEDNEQTPSAVQNNKNYKSLHFCENPEITRARAEQHRRNVEEKRHGKRSYFQNSNYGKANAEKTQMENNEDRSGGTNADISGERHRKTVYKATNANHNRKYLGDRKRRV